jgi:hypothetical protein
MTLDELKEARFRGPVRFIDGAKGMAQQDFECVANPRLGYSWRRENRQDKGRQFYTVDGREVADLNEVVRLLALPVDANSPAEYTKRCIDEFMASPRLNYGATRALSEAKCNVTVGPFGGLRSWMKRAGHAWHVGINAFAEDQHIHGVKFESYQWLYNARNAAEEVYRLMHLFESDRKTDTVLICDFGTRCRECLVLKHIETKMLAVGANPKLGREIEHSDIDAAKAWTCITHILTQGRIPTDGVFVTCEHDRNDATDDATRLAALYDRRE